MNRRVSLDESRRAQFVRQWRVLVLLRQGPKTLRELADATGVHTRTARRDLYALQRVPFPIVSRYRCPSRRGIRSVDPNLWALGEMPEWPRPELSPIAELGAGV